MKTKFNLKLLILVSILLILMCLFNTNMVQATDVKADETKTIQEEMDEKIAKLIPDTISIDVTESETLAELEKNKEIEETYTYQCKTKDLVANKFNDILKSNGITLPIIIQEGSSTTKINYGVGFEGEGTYEAQFDMKNVDIHTICIYKFSESTTGGSSGSAGGETEMKINIKYSESSNSNETDKKYVQNVANKLNNEIYRLFDLGTEIKFLEDDESIYNFIVEKINDSSIQVETMAVGGYNELGVVVDFYKNGIKYVSKEITIHSNYGFELSNGTPVIMSAIEKDNNTYKEMAKELEKNGLKNIIGCYELTAYGTTSNNMKVSFNIGTNCNGKEVKILHKKNDNTYETFTTKVENGKATITVNEFSPFIIALNDTANTNNTNNITSDKKLDDEPKTGVADYTIFASVIVLISLGGIVTLKLKK